MPYVYLIAAFSLNAAANVFLKLAAMRGFSFAAFFRGEILIAHVYAAAAVIFFGLNLVFYLFALEKLPLSIAYPIMIAMTFFITTGVALALGERITLIHALGLALIVLGVGIIVRAS